jgi:antitoxin MazE
METQIERWGDSLVDRIPEAIVQSTGFAESVHVDFECVRRGQLVIRAALPNLPTLDELIDGITDDNLHGEIDTGASVGAEAW